jgi:rSAM/selenodomain-associated transferase 1
LTERVACIVIAKAPRPGLCKTRLEPVLGADGCARLQAVLLARAARWAAEVGDPYVVFTPADAEDEVAALAPGATLVPQVDGHLGDRLAAAFRHVLAVHDGPVILVGVDTPQLRRSHADAALEDLRDGCDVTIGPANDGGWYLMGLREPHDELFDLPAEAWGGPEVFGLTLEAAHRAGLSLGMLRSERDIDEEVDAQALLADPCAPGDVVAVLRAAG